MGRYEVTFETKCYEKDWEIILKTDRLEKAIKNCNYDFKERVLYINNVNDIKKVSAYAQKLVDRKVLTSYVIVDEHADQVLRYFNISKEDFKGGYYYSIQELTGIYLCRTEYLLHFSGDAMITKPFDWIDDAIEKINSSDKIKTANPVWNNKYNEAKNESSGEDDKFYIGYGFSDQCYLIKTEDFKKPIYNEKNVQSERYPKYGGELFEKRTDAWMRNNDFLRLTCKKGSYIHKNFPKNKMLQLIQLAIKN